MYGKGVEIFIALLVYCYGGIYPLPSLLRDGQSVEKTLALAKNYQIVIFG